MSRHGAGRSRRTRGRADGRWGGRHWACGWALSLRAGAGGRTGARLAGARQWRAGRAQQGRGLGSGCAAWPPGLAKGCALGALSLFLARFDSVFFLSQIFEHCS